MMTSSEIRSKFLDFFAGRGHRVVRSSSLVPANDPTLLFSNAGMNQFKDVFLGREKRDYTRACSSQKCVRAGGKHNDLEQVGRTARHLTFFEMLGNFSFGDYFKKEAIPWAWELITREFAIPKEKLYVSVFREDDEAEEIWAHDVGVPRERIFRLDEKDNFWAMGDTGPCGPCSEIHFDQGPAASDLAHADCQFPCDCGRYVELWNLVFMQFNRDEQGTLTPLPRPSIDTGAGLERLSAVLQGKLSIFDSGVFQPLIQEAADLANVEYGVNHETDVSLRIIADHARTCVFLISDGVLPSNEGRGYVLRLILRRALYHGQTLGLNEPFLFKMSGHVVEMMKDAYPELLETERHVAKAIKIEEERYEQTTRAGMVALDSSPIVTPSEATFRFEHVRKYLLDANKEARDVFFGSVPAGFTMRGRNWIEFKLVDLKHPPGPGLNVPGEKLLLAGTSPLYAPAQASTAHQRVPPDGKAWVPGEALFTLHDTFGLRPDFVRDVVRNYGLDVDLEGYEAEMQKQRERARASWKGAEKKVASPVYQQLAEKHQTAFYGYTETETHDCRIVGLVVKGESVSEVAPGTEVEIVLDRTPFYAESGGQVGDIGCFMAPGSPEHVAQINDTYRPVTGLTAHKAVAKEILHVGDLVTARVDSERRDSIRRNHTATHLLHAALRLTLGTHVKQAGSLVAPDRLRFDFSHYAALGEQDLLDIEDLVNEHILKNEEVATTVMDLDTAVNTGAMALFGEKYADQVRVLTIAGFSKELCGGTHVRRTGDIGLFKITSESSVAAGVRRIEAFTGTGVLEALRREMQTRSALSAVLRTNPDDLLEAAEKLEESNKAAQKQLASLQEARMRDEAQRLFGPSLERASLQQAQAVPSKMPSPPVIVKGVPVYRARVTNVFDRVHLRFVLDVARQQTHLDPGVIVLGAVIDGNVALVAWVSKDLVAKLDAGKIVKSVAALVDGSGGGRKDLAEAGGKSPEKLVEALDKVPGIVERML